MKKKTIKIDPRSANAVSGWVLVARDESDMDLPAYRRPWYIGWHEVFTRRRAALDFARDHCWPKGYRAVRASLQVSR